MALQSPGCEIPIKNSQSHPQPDGNARTEAMLVCWSLCGRTWDKEKIAWAPSTKRSSIVGIWREHWCTHEPRVCVIYHLCFLSSLFWGAFNLWDTCGWGKNQVPGNWKLLVASWEARATHFSPLSVSFSRKVRDSEFFCLSLPPFNQRESMVFAWKWVMIMINIILMKDIVMDGY